MCNEVLHICYNNNITLLHRCMQSHKDMKDQMKQAQEHGCPIYSNIKQYLSKWFWHKDM